jgi:hypothetical protein
MGTRFAGSQRVGDRRRRLMSAGADDTGANPVSVERLSAGAGISRLVDQGHTNDQAGSPRSAIGQPLAKLVPHASWQYLAVGLSGLAVGGAITAIGSHAAVLTALIGPGIGELCSLPNGPATKWFSSVLLVLAAQVALLVWWARAQSLKDFDGRYWLWMRVAGACLVFSGCVATDAQAVCLSIVRHFYPQLGGWRPALCWLIPAVGAGSLLVRSLSREMRGCRGSRLLMFAAAVCYLIAALSGLEADAWLSPAARGLATQSGLIVGHVSLCMALWYHARHVLHCTADPACTPKRTWRIPRPHFKIPSLRMFRKRHAQGEGTQLDRPTDVTRARRKKSPPTVAPEPKPEALPEVKSAAEPQAGESAPKPKIRIDGRHAGLRDTNEREASDSPGRREPQDPRTGRDPVSIARQPQQQAPVELSELSEARSAAGASAADAEVDDDSDATGGESRPDLRGLSKKQRRRLMQEMRDRERATTR